MASNLWTMILAGGKGERFWPLSRRQRPKPLLDLGTGRTLLGRTLQRAASVSSTGRIRVVAGKALAPLLQREVKRKGTGRILLEPAPRNTGPAALWASRWVHERDPEGTILLLPSDHRVTGLRKFASAVRDAKKLAEEGFLVTFGIRPTRPDPEFGYILRGARIHAGAHRVDRFREKPPVPSARRLLKRGALWNSGMFLWRAATFLEEAKACEPAFGRWLHLCEDAGIDSMSTRRAFGRLPALPVDRAVMERSRRVAVVQSGFGWSDLGAWQALYEIGRKDAQGNVGWGRWVALGSRENQIYSSQGLCVIRGVKDLLVARSGDVVLVVPRSEAAAIREIVRELAKRGLSEYL